jgi:hypothetical protein
VSPKDLFGLSTGLQFGPKQTPPRAPVPRFGGAPDAVIVGSGLELQQKDGESIDDFEVKVHAAAGTMIL